MNNIKTYLLGVFEISLFMKEGVTRFNSDVKSFWWSFAVLVPNLFLIPISIPFVYASDPQLQKITLDIVILLFLIKMVLVVLVLVVFSYLMCKILKREQSFVHYIITSNWTSLTALILYIPFIVIMKMGVSNYLELAPYLLIISIYIYSLVAFVTKHILKIPWELAAFIAICTLAINESFFDILYLFTK